MRGRQAERQRSTDAEAQSGKQASRQRSRDARRGADEQRRSLSKAPVA